MKYITSKTRTRLKRSLLVVGALLLLWHIATGYYLISLDWQWQLSHDTYKPSWDMSILEFANIALYGVIGFLVPLYGFYEAFEERSMFSFLASSENKHYTPWHKIAMVLLPAVFVGSMISGYNEMLTGVAAGLKPTRAAEAAFEGYLWVLMGTVMGLLILRMLAAVLEDIWKPAEEHSTSTYTSTYYRYDDHDDDKSDDCDCSDDMGRLALGFLLGWWFFG